MRLGLVHPVQVERPVDRAAPAGELALEPPLDRRERRGSGLLGLRSPPCAAGGRRRRRGRLRREGPRRRRQARAAAARDAARDLGPERDLLVAEAPQAMRRLAPPSQALSDGQQHGELPAMADRAGARAGRVAARRRICRRGPVRQSPSPCPARSSGDGTGAAPRPPTAGPPRSRTAGRSSRATGRPRSSATASARRRRRRPGRAPGSKSSTSLKNTNERLRRIRASPRLALAETRGAEPGFEARERHRALGDLAGLDQDPPDRRVGQAVAAVVGEPHPAPVRKLDLGRALHMDEKGFDRVADPDDRIAPLPFDRLPVVIGKEEAVASSPRAGDAFGKPWRRLARREGSRGRGGGRGSASGTRSVSTSEPATQRLVVAGQEPRRRGRRGTAGTGFRRSAAPPPDVRGSDASAARAASIRRVARVSGRRGRRSPLDQRAGRALEAAERLQMVVVAEAREIVECRAGSRRGASAVKGQRSAWVAVSSQLGSRERTSRTKVQRSRWSTTSVGEPSTTAPALSRVTEASLLAKRTLICAVRAVELRGGDRRRRRSTRRSSSSCGPPRRGRESRRRNWRTPPAP